MLLVLMDNATAEYTFISVFFAPARAHHIVDSPALNSSQQQELEDGRRPSIGVETVGSPPMQRRASLTHSVSNGPQGIGLPQWDLSKEELATLGQVWKQIMDPALNYCQVFTCLPYDSHDLPMNPPRPSQPLS